MEESTYRSAILSRENWVKFNSDPSGNRAAPKGRTIIHGTENSNSRTIGPTVQIVLQETKFCCGYHCSERITLDLYRKRPGGKSCGDTAEARAGAVRIQAQEGIGCTPPGRLTPMGFG